MSIFPTKVLLATDGSKEAELATRIAAELANKTGSELHVVHVFSVIPWYPAYPEATDFDETELEGSVLEEDLQRISEQRARELLEAEVEKVRSVGGTLAQAHLAEGGAPQEIVSLAEEVGAGLIVMGSRGQGGIRRALMGSVSLSVVHHAHCSVLVVRSSGDQQEKRYPPGKVLLAFDGSKEASAAARVAVEFANATGSELHILHVTASEPYPPPFAYIPYDEMEAWEAREANLERDEERARSLVERQAQRMEAQGAKVAEVHLLFGKADKEIVRLAEDLGAGLVVVGNRGRGGIRRALMGSVSDSVVKHAHCPVLVVRPEK
jgi:nucleotide-binding universal stress UspA family protein